MAFTDIWAIRPEAAEGAVLRGAGYRITVLTDRLLRLEYDAQERFCDTATQLAIDRRFPLPAFSARARDGWLTVETACLRLRYDGRAFSPEGLSVALKGQYGAYASVWRFGDAGRNLKGTARTLDDADGAIPLADGLMGLEGYAALDDSRSMGMDATGALTPAIPHGVDLYLFAYGRDFKAALRDFYHLAGRAPALPRYALGNWWSRYYPYTQQSYLTLMARFAEEAVPLCVAVLDMNWHLTDIDPKYGPGWTGYTWDRALFPDPEGLLRRLHEMGLRVTLNDHPADGVRAFEDLYPAMAAETGADAAAGEPVTFDAGSPRYLAAFEKCVLDAFDRQGVDFWWLDWQQGGGSSVPGVDPLFVLNHTRYLYAARAGAPAMAFSRYGGPGSHRYPVGFSGDSHVTWASLAFQPYFTATAANIGYGWWSHDIGGHMHGVRDEELATRWVQFGVLSPVMRLHACQSEFLGKEPWNYPEPARRVMIDWLRLRHRLLPWLYTKNVTGSREGLPILYPVYYDWPDVPEAYAGQADEYMLGGELLAAPITAKADDTGLARATLWLPDGEWVDFFTGRRYPGGQRLRVYRDLAGAPVFARPGTVIPMDGGERLENGGALPRTLLFRAFAGRSGSCGVIEDNGRAVHAPDYRACRTRCTLEVDGGMTLTIHAPEGTVELLPEGRAYVVELVGVEDRLPDEVDVACTAAYDARTRTLRLTLGGTAGKGARLRWYRAPECPPPDRPAMLREALLPLRMNNDDKDAIMSIAARLDSGVRHIAAWRCLDLPDAVMGLLEELELVH